MGFDKNGNWSSDFYPEQDRDNEVPITASKFQALIQDNLKQSFQNCITRDGAGKPTADFNLNSHKITGVADGSGKNEVANIGQVQKNLFLYAEDSSLSANSITITLSPNFTQYLAGQQFYFKVANNSTASEVSFNANGAGVCRVRMNGSDEIPFEALKKGVVYHGVYTVDNTLTSEATYAGRRLQILGEAVNDEKVLNHKQVTNCILSAPNGVATQSGLTVTCPKDLLVLLWQGTNADGTINNTQFTTPAESVYSFLAETQDGIYFLFLDSSNALTVARDSKPQVGKVIVAKVVIEESSITEFVAYQPIELCKMSDIALKTPEFLHNSMPDFSRIIDISGESEYTAPDDGYIFAYSGNGKLQGCSLTVQGVNLISTGRNDVDVDATSMTAPIGKGETCTLSASGGKIFFVPCIGA